MINYVVYDTKKFSVYNEMVLTLVVYVCVYLQFSVPSCT